jgi:hypothetical protein
MKLKLPRKPRSILYPKRREHLIVPSNQTRSRHKWVMAGPGEG